MKFSAITVVAALAFNTPSVSAFGVRPSQLNQNAFASSLNAYRQTKPVEADPFDSLQNKLLTEPPAPETKPGKKEKPVKEKKEKPVKEKPAKKVAPAPTPAPVVTAAPASSYDLGDSLPTKSTPKVNPKVVTPKTIAEKKEKAPPKPKAPKAPVEKVSSPVPGVALGAAPLIAVPVVGLGALRSTLTKTKARRDEIAAEIEAFEKAQAKKKLQGDVDGAGVAKAAVSYF